MQNQTPIAHLKLLLKPSRSNTLFDAIAFNTVDSDWPEGVAQVQIAYRMDINGYRDRHTLQLMVEHVRPLPDVAARCALEPWREHIFSLWRWPDPG